MLACEHAKRRLSTEETVRIEEEFIAEKDGQTLHLSAALTRQEFEALIDPFVERTIRSVHEALRGADLTIHHIDDLVLVGVSTRIPLVETRLRDEFLREPSRAVDPDLAVALGAAVQAAMIDGQTVGPVLVDVTRHILGIEVCEGMTYSGPAMVFSPIIHRNTPLPARYEQAYSTMYPEQEGVEVHVLQGERREVYRNQSIGRFHVDLEPGGGECSKLVVRFDLSLDGTLKVTVTQPATGHTKDRTIDNALNQFRAGDRDRAEARLEAMFNASEELMAADAWPRAEPPRGADDSVAPIFAVALGLLRKAETLKPSIASEDADDLASLCRNLKEAMAANDPAAVAAAGAELDDLLFYVQ